MRATSTQSYELVTTTGNTGPQSRKAMEGGLRPTWVRLPGDSNHRILYDLIRLIEDYSASGGSQTFLAQPVYARTRYLYSGAPDYLMGEALVLREPTDGAASSAMPLSTLAGHLSTNQPIVAGPGRRYDLRGLLRFARGLRLLGIAPNTLSAVNQAIDNVHAARLADWEAIFLGVVAEAVRGNRAVSLRELNQAPVVLEDKTYNISGFRPHLTAYLVYAMELVDRLGGTEIL